ncbi:hypothetical protein [Fictibacillus sp. NRS-1165]|uniref:hypothetical protein n=1 Tax=Fictibacillus sp. NRS-1165 TaxID=3144463 RepID=UPI003D24AA27
MKISGVKSIKNIDLYIKDLEEHKVYFLGLKIDQDIQPKLINLGFDMEIRRGDALLPDIRHGRFSKFNTLGSFKKRRDLPKEEHCYSFSRDIKDWHGNDHYVIITRCVKRIAREEIPAPEVELLIVCNEREEKYLIANQSIDLKKIDKDLLKLIINLFLELFGYVEFLYNNLTSADSIRNIPLRWEVLPQGDLPWEKKNKYIEGLVTLAARGQKRLLSDRLQQVEKLKPNFRAMGINGYRGYIVYGFESKNIYIFESAFYGNATYIIKGEWKEISKLSKSEIINSKLCKKRLIHDNTWESKIKDEII